MKIVIAEKVAANAVQVLKQEAEWTIVTHDQVDGNLVKAIADTDALIVRSAVDVTAELLQGAKKLRVIGRAGVGVDNIDLDAATKAGIVVMNTPGANAVAVAEHTFALMLALARQLPRADATTRAGKWEKKSLQGTELRGKVLGIVGLGKIGIELARRARAFEMKVIAHDPYVAQTVASGHGVEIMELNALYAAADFLSLHVGLTPQTTGMINESSLAKMKRGVRIVNCARGELIDEAALAAALTSKQVGGAAIDVFREEPPKNSPLLALENVVATPHIAGSTHEAQDAVGVQIMDQVREYLKRGVIRNAVNMPSIDDQQYEQMRPYMALAEKLGIFLACLVSGPVQEIAIQYSGRIAEWKTELVRNAAIQGVLNQQVEERANVVNAASLAHARGIQISESKSASAASMGDVLSLTLKTATGQHTARGGVLRGSSLRLLGIDDIGIEVPLEGKLIYLRNRDVPGVVGALGATLGRHKINIGNLALGRFGGPGTAEAMAVVQVDEAPPEAVLQELRQNPNVKEVRWVQF
ncbi:MAG TPA: phosphoglycerate dehydrogenase [Candidatus Saccharimonadales bacterium]|jgi:D-3-phosphoglycerate dehydrogenase|nr:phosphoglycerate dehydrogenase [Candidatus Saccharimonadales bacterium]